MSPTVIITPSSLSWWSRAGDQDERGLDGQLLTPSDIGDVNRSRVIQAFCDFGPLSRADLAKMAGVTRATIGNIVSGSDRRRD